MILSCSTLLMMKIHEKAHEKEETLGAEGQKFFKKAILRDDSSSLRYSLSKKEKESRKGTKVRD